MNKTAAQQLIDWIRENPTKINKILADWGGSDHPEDIANYKQNLFEQLTAINNTGEC